MCFQMLLVFVLDLTVHDPPNSNILAGAIDLKHLSISLERKFAIGKYKLDIVAYELSSELLQVVSLRPFVLCTMRWDVVCV